MYCGFIIIISFVYLVAQNAHDNGSKHVKSFKDSPCMWLPGMHYLQRSVVVVRDIDWEFKVALVCQYICGTITYYESQ